MLAVTHTQSLRYFDVISADGTHVRAWTNDVEGPRIFLANGLGTNPFSWPSLLRDDCGVNVTSWNHRGTGGSGYAVNGRVDLAAFVEDAVAVMDQTGFESGLVASWSAGVNVAFELARQHPERVTGILAVAGVPGDTLATSLAPFRIPWPLAKQLMVAFSHTVGALGDVVAPVTRGLPLPDALSRFLRLTRLIDPNAQHDELRALLEEFLTTHPGWYAQLAIGLGQTSRISLSGMTMPTTFIAGRRDLLVGPKFMRTAAERLPDSRFVMVNATHFIPVEYPDLMIEEIHALLARIGEIS